MTKMVTSTPASLTTDSKLRNIDFPSPTTIHAQAEFLDIVLGWSVSAFCHCHTCQHRILNCSQVTRNAIESTDYHHRHAEAF